LGAGVKGACGAGVERTIRKGSSLLFFRLLIE